MNAPTHLPNWEKIQPTWERIRPFRDEEVPTAVASLLQDEALVAVARSLFPPLGEMFLQKLPELTTIAEFKSEIAYHIVGKLLANTAFSYDLTGKSHLQGLPAATFVSNHRDIILDSAILNVLLFEAGMEMPRIAIGDNLLLRPWIRTVVKLNDSIIVERSLPPRAFLDSACAFSLFLDYSIQEEKKSVWIAQREGRAKDSDDRTQIALLKMMALAGGDTPLENLRRLHIVPTAISYEYDPCDYLKAKEILARGDNAEYHKAPDEDLQSMQQGLLGQKGRIHFNIGRPLNMLLEEWSARKKEALPTKPIDLFPLVATLVDGEIHSRYRFYPGNYVAEDLLSNGKKGLIEGHYSQTDKERFEQYLAERIALATPSCEEEKEALRQLILLQYANPLINYHKCQSDRQDNEAK